MHQRLSPATFGLLAFSSLLWAINAVVGRMVHTLVPPMTLNLLRWSVALVLLLPLAYPVFRPASPMWSRWRYYLVLGLFGIGCYNSLQYLALQTSQPVNVTLVGSSVPLWTMLVGRLFFHAPIRRMQMVGAAVSMVGVLTVLSHGSLASLLALKLVPGDGFMVLANIGWAFYSWLLARPDTHGDPTRQNWARFLAAQTFFGVLCCGLFTASEWTLGTPSIHWGWPLIAAVAYVGIFPSIIAYRAYGTALHKIGPTVASFFVNLTPLFAALLSATFLGETPHAYHAVAFLLIVAGIVVSSRR